MDALVHKVEALLSGLPVALGLELPSGRRVGPADAAVRLTFREWSSLATLAGGQIGRLAEDYVEARVGIEVALHGLGIALLEAGDVVVDLVA